MGLDLALVAFLAGGVLVGDVADVIMMDCIVSFVAPDETLFADVFYEQWRLSILQRMISCDMCGGREGIGQERSYLSYTILHVCYLKINGPKFAQTPKRA